ncbi:hypothetical protein E2C01_039962 [Portunus trituberculatus]|uniref:Uncharacterized protein n=1 Tax=Portunus trituberculatus TaxID=210409 RepID=A0A5B7FMN9_PORTR|nr:hypothetical protein [Portunus trituberculatus]
MDPSSFYGSHDDQDTSDEDFTLTNVSYSSSSEESDEAGETESNGTDELGETDDEESASTSRLAPVQGWGPVSSKQRPYAFSGTEELETRLQDQPDPAVLKHYHPYRRYEGHAVAIYIHKTLLQFTRIVDKHFVSAIDDIDISASSPVKQIS